MVFMHICYLWLFDATPPVCACNRFARQDLTLLRDPRATLLWKDEGLQFLVQNSKYFAGLLLSICVNSAFRMGTS